MILVNFRKNNLAVQFLWIAIVFTALFFYPVGLSKATEYSVLYNTIYDGLLVLPVLAKVISYISILLSALFVNFLMRRFELIPRMNFLPMMIYLLLAGSFPNLLNFNPLTIANLFIFSGFYFLFKVNEEEFSYSSVFSSSLLFSIASLFYLPFISIFIILPFIYIIFRIFKGREMIISSIAFSIPWVFVAVYYYVQDILQIRVHEFINVFVHFSIPDLKAFSVKDIILAAFFVFIALVVAFRVLLIAYEQLIQVRILTSFTVLYLVFTSISIGLSGNYFLIHPLLILFPLTVVFASFLKNLKNTFYLDILLFLIIAGVFVNAIVYV